MLSNEFDGGYPLFCIFLLLLFHDDCQDEQRVSWSLNSNILDQVYKPSWLVIFKRNCRIYSTWKFYLRNLELHYRMQSRNWGISCYCGRWIILLFANRLRIWHWRCSSRLCRGSRSRPSCCRRWRFCNSPICWGNRRICWRCNKWNCCWRYRSLSYRIIYWLY